MTKQVCHISLRRRNIFISREEAHPSSTVPGNVSIANISIPARASGVRRMIEKRNTCQCPVIRATWQPRYAQSLARFGSDAADRNRDNPDMLNHLPGFARMLRIEIELVESREDWLDNCHRTKKFPRSGRPEYQDKQCQFSWAETLFSILWKISKRQCFPQ